MKQETNNFEKNVFINCPFDPDYGKMLKALVFTTITCGLEPRIALERDDSGEERINKIKELIRCSKYSIHDISRMEPLRNGDLPRFNLPFELGLDLGCRTYGKGRLATKNCLILDKEKYRYTRVISDISGNDIRAHNANDQDLIREVRNWLRTARRVPIPGAHKIWMDFNIFDDYLLYTCKKEGYDEHDLAQMPILEYVYYLRRWFVLPLRRIKED
jgi:hypothetical protein